MTSLAGKKIVVTGAGRSTGRALAAALADQGAELHISARDISAAEGTCEFIKNIAGKHASAYGCDIASLDEIRGFATDVRRSTSSIDILINNAATWLPGSLTDTKDKDLLACVNSTVSGTMLTTKHFLPLLKKSDMPDVLTIVSQSGLTVRGGAVPNEAYRAAKSAQAAFMNGLRQAHPEMRIMSIFPPDFESDLEYKSQQWGGDFAPGSARTMTARHVVNAILFALQQDRICTIETLALANSQVA